MANVMAIAKLLNKLKLEIFVNKISKSTKIIGERFSAFKITLRRLLHIILGYPLIVGFPQDVGSIVYEPVHF